jgi:hypothetical protein
MFLYVCTHNILINITYGYNDTYRILEITYNRLYLLLIYAFLVHDAYIANTTYINLRAAAFTSYRIKAAEVNKKVIYWCVAYLPSEASIIEH